MTSNQIAFRNYEETVRHDREMERLTGEQQAEVQQHNRQTEMIASLELAEKRRTNQANEYLKQQTNAINATHYGRQDELTKLKYSTDAYVALGQMPTVLELNAAQTELARQKSSTELAQQNLLSSQVAKTQSETKLTEEKALSEQSQRQLNAAKVFETYAATKTEQVRAQNLLFDNSLKQAQKQQVDAQTENVKAQTTTIIPESNSRKFLNYTGGINNITRSVLNIKSILLDDPKEQFRREKIYAR